SILERKAPPTFDIVVEIQSWDRVAVHRDVAETVDALLRGYSMPAEVRELDERGEVRVIEMPRAAMPGGRRGERPRRRAGFGSSNGSNAAPDDENGASRTASAELPRRIYPFGISRNRLEQAIRETGSRATIADDLQGADAVMTLRTYFRRKPQAIRDAEARGIPIYVLKTNTVVQMEQSLLAMRSWGGASPEDIGGPPVR